MSRETRLTREKQREENARRCQLIVASGLFDVNYYLATNPDVAVSGFDPLLHFILHGIAEERKPNPLLNIQFFINQGEEKEPSILSYEDFEKAIQLNNDPHPMLPLAWHQQRQGKSNVTITSLFEDIRNNGIRESEPLSPCCSSSQFVALHPELNRWCKVDVDKNKNQMITLDVSPTVIETHIPDTITIPLQRYSEAYRSENAALNQVKSQLLYSGHRVKLSKTLSDACSPLTGYLNWQELIDRATGTNATVSVVIPLYNHELYIKDAIESLLRQTLQPSEILVIDDGSTDNSANVVRKMACEDSRIRFWSRENRGAHATINEALTAATGDYIAILNSDDKYHPARLAVCLSHLQQNNNCRAVATRSSIIDAVGATIDGEANWYHETLLKWESADLKVSLKQQNLLLTTSNLVMERSLFDELGDFRDYRYVHDWDYFLRIVKETAGLCYIPVPLLQYRTHRANTIGENKQLLESETQKLFSTIDSKKLL